MKLAASIHANRRGSALVMVFVLSAVTLLIMASTLQWTTTNTVLSHRNNEYYRTVSIAEAATEKVVTRIDSDYKTGGDSLVISNISSYATITPTTNENAIFSRYEFKNGLGVADRTYVEFVGPTVFRQLTGPYEGLFGYSSKFRIISNARDKTSLFNIVGAVEQGVELATIPLFQFAIFYNLDLEINPGATMTVTGPVHGNQNIYLNPGAALTFQSDVTSARYMINNKKPGDPLSRSGGSVTFQAEHDDGVSSLNLPIGTNNSPSAVREVVEPPPAGESSISGMGRERFYNKGDLIVTLTGSGSSTNPTVSVKAGSATGTTVPQAQWDYFLNPGIKFYNKRENKTVNCLDIDVGRLRSWDSTNSSTTHDALPKGNVTIIYVNDQRDFSSISNTWEPGVRVTNGTWLPPQGLTIATRDPIYVFGNYNTRDNAGNSSGHNTLNTEPAALIGDAITILSPTWKDTNSTLDLSSRVATNTTVNAAFLAGVVETVSGSYSGGVENFPRFLENWSGKTLTYNGSMVVMYESRIATGLWQGTGDPPGIYNPPNRDWAFDQNFRDVNKLPPGTPCARTLVRSTWAMIKPNSTTPVAP